MLENESVKSEVNTWSKEFSFEKGYIYGLVTISGDITGFMHI